jgi:integrase
VAPNSETAPALPRASLGSIPKPEIPDVHIHDLRHTFASLLVSSGASMEMIGRLLGHTQIGTTQRYAHLIDSPLRAVGQRGGEEADAEIAGRG